MARRMADCAPFRARGCLARTEISRLSVRRAAIACGQEVARSLGTELRTILRLPDRRQEWVVGSKRKVLDGMEMEYDLDRGVESQYTDKCATK